jgi:Na+-driven multidrug efflux pump
MAIEFTVGGALRGAGDTRFPLFSLLTGLFVFRLGGAFLLLSFFDPDVVAIWCCLIGDYFVKALLLGIRFHRGRWKTLEI